MFYFKQFESFDPLNGDVPGFPFEYMPEIATRARSMLVYKSKDKITAAAVRSNSEIEQYFRDMKTQAVDELQVKLRDDQEEFLRCFEWDGGNSWSGMWVYRDDMDEELEIPTARNTSEVDALKTIIEDRDSCFFLPKGAPVPDIDHWQEGVTHELFAVLSLWLLADAIEWVQNGGKYSLSIAGEYAIKAMDAVCHAEHVREVEWLEQFHKKSLVEISKAEASHLQEQADRVRQNVESEIAAHQQSNRSARSAELNRARHAKRNDARRMVAADWEKNINSYPSAEQAGNFYADWLEERGVGYIEKGQLKYYQPRAVTEWIRKHAKEKGIKFR